MLEIKNKNKGDKAVRTFSCCELNQGGLTVQEKKTEEQMEKKDKREEKRMGIACVHMCLL